MDQTIEFFRGGENGIDQNSTWFSPLWSFICVVSVVIIWYNLFWKTVEGYGDYTNYGFDSIKNSGFVTKSGGGGKKISNKSESSSLTKKNLINEMQRRRKIGKIPPPYPNGWFIILESCQLKTGRVAEVDVLGLNLVAWRGASGIPYVADAYCPHLGSHLGSGTVEKECITCPFHGWQYSGDANGQLTKIPYSDSKLESVKLNMKTILEQNGCIYLWYHVDGEEPTWTPMKVPQIEKNGGSYWPYRGRVQFRVATHIQDIMENFIDKNHLAHVHGTVVGIEDGIWNFLWNFFVSHIAQVVVTFDVDTEWTPGGSSGQNKNESESHTAFIDVTSTTRIFKYFSLFQIHFHIVQDGPGLTFVTITTPIGQGISVKSSTPIDPLMQIFTQRFYTSPTFIHPLAMAYMSFDHELLRVDSKLWNRNSYLHKPILPKEDVGIKLFRNWYSQFYTNKEETNESNLNGILKTGFCKKEDLQF